MPHVNLDQTLVFNDTQYFIESKIGEGSSGIVVIGRHSSCPPPSQTQTQTQTQIQIQQQGEDIPHYSAIKIFSHRTSRYYWREKKALEKLRGCGNIVRMERAVTGLSQCYIIMEECNGDLYEMVSDNRRLPEEKAKLLFIQMATGVMESHIASICHHDIKLENFLIDRNGQIKLSDFGYSIDTDDKEWIEGASVKGIYSAGSPAYSSPQVLNKQPHSPILNDIYGLGVCLYRILCGSFPFCDPEKDSLRKLKRNVEALASKDLASVLPFPQDISQKTIELICGMIAFNEADRWDWIRIMQFEW